MKDGLSSQHPFVVVLALAGVILSGSEGMAQRGGRGGGGGASAGGTSSSSSGGFSAAGGAHRAGGKQGRGAAVGGLQGFGLPGFGIPGGFPGEMPGVMQQNGAQHCTVTVSENGKTTSVTQDPQKGIQVIFSQQVDGREVRDIIEAANPMELRRKRPEAFDAYQRLILGGPKGVAARGDGAAVGAERKARAEGRAEAKDGARSISVSRLGKTVTITEDDEKGITVALKEMIGGREVNSEVNAANAAELKRKNEMAYRLYQQYSGGLAPVADGDEGRGVVEDAKAEARGARLGDAGIPPADARAQLRAELLRQAEAHADNPQMQILIQKMLKELEL